MKTAKEMFEELGYKKVKNDKKFLDYLNNEKDFYITFLKEYKTFCKTEYGYDCGEISMQELKAINKQVKELNWNE